MIVTPGIRLEKNVKNDQARVLTPNAAFDKGTDYIVVGRPIMNSKVLKKKYLSVKKIKYMIPFIKICGIKKYDHIKVAEKHGALWYGLFFIKNPLDIDLNKAEKIVEKLLNHFSCSGNC